MFGKKQAGGVTLVGTIFLGWCPSQNRALIVASSSVLSNPYKTVKTLPPIIQVMSGMNPPTLLGFTHVMV